MKKNGMILTAVIFSGFAFSQVGINTPSPKASLDIMAKNPKGNTTSPEGLLIPRVDRQRAQSMTGVQTSTLIYVNDATSGSRTGNALNIDAEGYYYYNGTVWAKLSPDSIINSINLYNSDGTLTANRIVQQNDRTLAFASTAATGSNHFSVAGNTFSVDAFNNRVGMGTIVPQNRLDMGPAAGTSAADVAGKKLAVYNTGAGTAFYGLGVSGNTLQIHAAAAADAAPRMVLMRSGRVGIGDPDPKANFDLVGSTFGIKNSAGSGSWDNLWFNVTAQGPTINASGAESGMQFRVGANAAGTYGNGQTLTTVATMTSAGNMGIGNTAPGQRLSVMDAGNTNQYSGIASFEANNRTQGVGIGYAGIQSIGSAANASINLNAKAAQSINLQTQATGSVGIGTASPSAGAILDLTSTTKGFLPPRMTTAQRDAMTARPVGTIVYNTSLNCMQYWSGTAWRDNCTGTITGITCASATNNGTLTRGVAASGVSSVIPYTGGNGALHTGQTVASTGVTGLTATLTAGNFANGNGNLTYTITGTPSAAGTASFAINIGGRTCTLTRNVVIPPGAITGITCTSATNNGTLTKGVAASGVSSVIPYTGGNGGTYNGQTVTSTGVTGLTATLAAGSFANGNGNLTYTITGTPSAAGTANFAINIGGITCTLTRTVDAPPTPYTATNILTFNRTEKVGRPVGYYLDHTIIGGSGGPVSWEESTIDLGRGLFARLLAGTAGPGQNVIRYWIYGTPTSAGTVVLNVSIGGITRQTTFVISN